MTSINMTDADRIRQQAVADIIKGVARKTLLINLGAAAAALVFALVGQTVRPWWFVPVSILFGGALGLLNFRWLAAAVQRVYLKKGATPGLSSFAAVIISVIKLSIIFVILFVVIKWQLLNVFGMVAGLSLCFLAILWEGLILMNHATKHES